METTLKSLKFRATFYLKLGMPDPQLYTGNLYLIDNVDNIVAFLA